VPDHFKNAGLLRGFSQRYGRLSSIQYSAPMHLGGWNLFFLMAFIVYVSIRGIFDRQTKNVEKVITRVDTVERVLLTTVGVASILLPLLYLFTPWLAFADYKRREFVPWCGAPILVAALWLFWRSHSDLGQNWSISLELRKGHELVTRGVYAAVRHPMYAAILLWDVGQGLLIENWLAGWSALVAFVVMCVLRIPREEQMMSASFGDAYHVYMRKTGRLFPRLR
jgi:protein-S-isoprenylcysteine O-methyltransferase Ste14